ncbi:uncharacterized protein LOC108665949 [Hyalella azteca]|uniref:Uncharacterized protein LOC108665949 n=1 Tax=Hyalella azteca TaxID=294128 RepID=A0A8B7N316_HYAAZ|nr:uncharacterized protein LOC108665949 [Hyalella azteca]
MSRNSIHQSNKPVEKSQKERPSEDNHLLETGIFHAMHRLELSPGQPYGDIHSTYDLTTQKNMTLSTLKIANITMAYDDADLSCWAANSNLSTPLEVKMQLEIFSPPSSVDLVDFPEAFTSGEPHPLSCRVYGSRPRPRLEWSLTKPDSPAMKLSTQDLNDPNFWSPLDGGGTSSRVASSTAVQTLQLSSTPSHSTKIDRTLLRKQSYSSGQLKVVLGKEDHGGKLSCVAWNNFFPNYKVNATKTIHVNYAPEVELELGVKIDPSQVREGTDLYFTCKVDSRPPADQLSWTHKNRTLKNDPVLGVLMSGEHLVLQSVTRDWSGTFSCTAANSVASVVSNTINISILYAPVCSIKVRRVHQVQLGEYVSLSCKIEAQPIDVQFEWTFATNVSKQELVSEEWVRSSEQQSRLRYRPEKLYDYGIIRCFAINAIGKQKQPCEYSVEPAPAPVPPTLNCSVTNQSWHSLNVHCELNQENSTAVERSRLTLDSQEMKERKELEALLEEWETGDAAPQHAQGAAEAAGDVTTFFTLTVESLNSQQVFYNATNNIGTFSVSGLTAGVDYSLTITAMTHLGPTEPLTLTALTLRAAENRINLNDNKGNSHESQFMDGTTLMAISIGCALAIFLCLVPGVALIAYRKSRRRGNDQRSNSQNTVTHDHLKLKTSASEAPDLITEDASSRDNLLTVAKLGPRTPNAKRQDFLGCSASAKDSRLGFCSGAEQHNCGLHQAASQPPSLMPSHPLKALGASDVPGLTIGIYNPMEAITERCLPASNAAMNYSAYDRSFLETRRQNAVLNYSVESNATEYPSRLKHPGLGNIGDRPSSSSQYNINLINNDADRIASAPCNQLLGYSNRFFTLPHKTSSNPSNFTSGTSRQLRTVTEASETGSKMFLEATYAGRSTESLCSPGSESRV